MTKLLSRAEYEKFIEKIPSGACTLCNLGDQITLGSSEHWLWIPCLSPYWRYHTMFIPKKHREDIAELTTSESRDLRDFYLKVKNHMLSLNLKHSDGKPMDQYILMVRIREDGVPGGSTYNKPRHLHLHFSPDREGVERFHLDQTATSIDMNSIALKD